MDAGGTSWTGRVQIAALAFVGLAALALAAPPATPAAQPTVWLCKPGVDPNPCYSSLQTTVIDPDGGSRVAEVRIARRPKIDCFYVYPTVSEDPGPNSDLIADPEEIAIAQYQASRFSERCRVFAPMYRQLTLSQISPGAASDPGAPQAAYDDVRDAWREYMKRHNKGRGVVLIGHSQGTWMLSRLVRETIDPFKRARRRLVSAILLGGDVLVKAGRDIGGYFKHLPGCRSRRRNACIVAFSTFDETPPDDAVFGKPGGVFAEALGLGGRTGLEVLCTNPAALRGGTATLSTLLPSTPFPGTIGLGVRIMFGGTFPTAPTPWLQPQDHYQGACVRSNGANVLMITPLASARDLAAVPDASWGLHLADGNIALGDLVALVGTQTKGFLKARADRRAKRRARSGR